MSLLPSSLSLIDYAPTNAAHCPKTYLLPLGLTKENTHIEGFQPSSYKSAIHILFFLVVYASLFFYLSTNELFFL